VSRGAWDGTSCLLLDEGLEVEMVEAGAARWLTMVERSRGALCVEVMLDAMHGRTTTDAHIRFCLMVRNAIGEDAYRELTGDSPRGAL
jgi:hypothetical protein